MQDRYRFRVWYKRGYDEPKEIMLYTAEQTYDYMRGDPEIIPADCFGELLENESFIVMQCTGLKDKYGELIFEGDILKETCKDDELGETYFDFTVVKWDKVCAGYIMYHPAYTRDTVFFDEAVDDGDNTGILKNFEVVGNIYENPDLIKEKGENNEQGK